MKPDYKNWIPKGVLVSLIAGTVLSLALLLVFGVFGIGVGGKLRIVLGVVFGIAFVVCAKYTEWCVYAYKSLCFTSIKDRHGVYAMINKDERRDVSIRKPRPSIRKQLADSKQATSPKKAAARTKKNELEV